MYVMDVMDVISSSADVNRSERRSVGNEESFIIIIDMNGNRERVAEGAGGAEQSHSVFLTRSI